MDAAADRPSQADLEQVLAAALAAEEQGPAALAAYLDALGDRGERVRTLLARLRVVPGLGDTAPVGVPRQLGDFRLVRRIGGGGMGVVYLAEQVSLGRPVAVKIIRADLLPLPGTRERFRREVEAVAAVQHPAVVPILAVGEQDDVPWLAMAWVPGRSMAEVVATLRGRAVAGLAGNDLRTAIGAVSPPTGGTTLFAGSYWQASTALLLQIAEAIAHAHAHGVVHRDLKPGNVMLTTDGRAVVLDFGLARMRGDVRLTRTGPGAGSPLYMSPEQHLGEATDERTDVYSLATTLAELLTLRAPYPADDFDRLRAQVLAGEFLPLRAGNAALPRELEIVVHKAMDRDRRQRYADMAAFADDLRRVLAGEPIAARPLPLHLRCVRSAARHPVVTGTMVTLLALLLAVPAALFAEQRHSAQSIAAAKERAERQFGVSQRTLARLMDRFSSSTFLNTPGSDTVSVAVLQEAVLGYRTLLGEALDNPEIRGRYAQSLANLAGAQARTGDVAAAEATFLASIAEYEWQQPPAVDAGLSASLQRILCGRLLYAHGRQAEARSHCARAIEDLSRLRTAELGGTRATLLLVDALSVLALVAQEQGVTAEVEALHQRAYDLMQSLRRAAPTDWTIVTPLAKTTSNLALLWQRRGEKERASQLFHEAVELLAGQCDEGTIDPQARTTLRATALAGYAYSLPQARAGDSEVAMREALGLCERQVRDFPATPVYLHDLAAYEHNFSNLLDWWGRQDEALDWLQRAENHESRFLQAEPAHVDGLQNAHNHLQDHTRILQNLGRYADALAVADLWLSLPGPRNALQAARVVGDIMQKDSDARDREARTAHLFELLQEVRRRGGTTDGWAAMDGFRGVVDDPRFEALLR